MPVQFPTDPTTGKAPFVTSVSCGGTFNLATTAKNQVRWALGAGCGRLI